MDSGAPANNMLEGKGSENGKEMENEMSCEAQISEVDPSISSVMNSIVSQVEIDNMSKSATTCVVEETKFSNDKSGCQLTLRFSNGGEDNSGSDIIIEEREGSIITNQECSKVSGQSTDGVAKLKYDTQLSPGGGENSIGCEKLGQDDSSVEVQQVGVNSSNAVSADNDEKAGSSKKSPSVATIFLPVSGDKKKANKTSGDAGSSPKTKAPSIKASLNICKIQNTLKALQSIPLSSSPVPSPRSTSSSSFLDQDSCSPRPFMCSSNESESCYYPEAAIVVNSNSSPATVDDPVVIIEEEDNILSSNDSKSPGLILESIIAPAIIALDEETQSSDSLFLVNGESSNTDKVENSTTTPILSTLNCVDVLNSDSLPFPEDKIVESSDDIHKAAAVTDEETQSLPGAIKEDPVVGVSPIVETLDPSLNISIGPPDKTLLEWKDDACLLQGLIDEDETNRLASNTPSTSSGANSYGLSNTGGFDTTSTPIPMSTDPIVVAATTTLSSSDFIVNHNNNNIDGKTETIPELSLPVSLLINSESSTSSSTREVVVEGEANLRQPPHSPTKVASSARSALKRRSDSTDLEECLQPKRKRRGIQFDGVTVYYFPRAQGFTCVPSQVKKHNLLRDRIMIMILFSRYLLRGTLVVQ